MKFYHLSSSFIMIFAFVSDRNKYVIKFVHTFSAFAQLETVFKIIEIRGYESVIYQMHSCLQIKKKNR